MKRAIFAGVILAVALHAQVPAISISPVPGTCGDPHARRYEIAIPIPQDITVVAVRFIVYAVLTDGSPVSTSGVIQVPQRPYPAGESARHASISATFSLGGIVGGTAVDQFVVQTANLTVTSEATVGVALTKDAYPVEARR